MLFTSNYIAVYRAQVRDPAVELRRMKTPLWPHIKWSCAYYCRIAHVV